MSSRVGGVRLGLECPEEAQHAAGDKLERVARLKPQVTGEQGRHHSQPQRAKDRQSLGPLDRLLRRGNGSRRRPLLEIGRRQAPEGLGLSCNLSGCSARPLTSINAVRVDLGKLPAHRCLRPC